MKLGSLFSGSGGFELAGALNGIEPVWASEVEPFPIRVTSLRFPGMKHLGDVTKINGAEIEPVDIITFGSPCFPAGTLVLTTEGHVPIESINIGDMVLTHTGSWKKVTAVGSHKSETVILRGNHYGLECTPNHPIYSAEVGKDYSRKDDGRRNNKLVLRDKREWVAAGYMEGKYWGVPRKIDPLPFDIPVNTNKKQNDMPEMNEDFWYFVGRWVGDGWVHNSKRSNRPNGQCFATIFLCGGLEEEDELIDTVSKISGRYSIERGDTGVKVKIHGRLLCDWLVRNFGCHATEKKIASWVYGIGSDNRKAFLRGVIDSDGNRINSVTESWNIATSSEKLANGLRIMAELEGYSTTIHRHLYKPTTIIDGRTVNVHPENYQVRITASERSRVHLCDELHSWYPVRTVTCSGESKTVYNMTVEEDNSYVANGIVVHNCQDLSIAGKQAGIHDGERSNLFFEAIRIIKEMRNATANKFPRFAVWENVPGAFSSNGGDDFRAVLQSFCSVVDPHADVTRPPDGAWQPAGCVLGDGYSVAWRVLDAQYFGVPQRRKRVFAVADFRSERAGEILFESEGMQWDPEKGREAWERASRYVAGCPDGGCELQWMKGIHVSGPCYALEGNGSRPSHIGNGYSDSGIMYTLNTIEQHSVCYDEAKKKCYAIENHPNDSRVTVDPNGIVQTLSSRMGTGGNNTPFVLITSTSPDFPSGNHTERQPCERMAEHSTADTKASCALNSSDRATGNAYCAGNGQLDNAVISPICSTLDCMHDQKMVIIEKDSDDMSDRKYVLRRLTPLECARLQGFPDWWCDGTGGSDTAMYKMWGNGVALPCVAFVLGQIAKEIEKNGDA